jgi:hypothetical protein
VVGAQLVDHLSSSLGLNLVRVTPIAIGIFAKLVVFPANAYTGLGNPSAYCLSGL